MSGGGVYRLSTGRIFGVIRGYEVRAGAELVGNSQIRVGQIMEVAGCQVLPFTKFNRVEEIIDMHELEHNKKSVVDRALSAIKLPVFFFFCQLCSTHLASWP